MILQIIKSLNGKKATGPNSSPTKVLKVFSKTISIPLANVINLSFKCGVFPMSLKVASVTPTHEKVAPLIAITTVTYPSYKSKLILTDTLNRCLTDV